MSSIKWSRKNASLMTKWASEVDPSNPLSEYPRPHWVRPDWLSLNGLWDYAIQPKRERNMIHSEGQILVPFAVESALSGVMRPLKPSQKLWYRRTFIIPDKWNSRPNSRIILHFGAVDWESTIWINDQLVGTHVGGFDAFSFDITDVIHLMKENSITIGVWDPTEKGRQEHGKQVLRPFGVNYTAVSGIWQTVWLECVHATYIESAQYHSDLEKNTITFDFKGVNINSLDQLIVRIRDGTEKITQYQGKWQESLTLSLENIKLWSPSHPFLYQLEFELQRDENQLDFITSYYGFRMIEIKKDQNGIMRMHLNNEPIFQYGPLDQGYWPDGLYTAPTDAALKYDIEIAKQLGFNMIRKHIKVEPARWYYYCDTIGMLVWQDMPCGGSQVAGALSNFLFQKKISLTYGRHSPKVQTQYYTELEAMVKNLYNFPSIIMWVPFNEGWGQFQTKQAVDLIRKLDSTRLINNASGWIDHQIGDVHDIHIYPGPGMPPCESNRAVVCGEFGGLGYQIKDHTWKIKFKWGYKKFTSQEDYQRRYQQLIRDLILLKTQGLSAAVYTQITDVEGEINGLLTYDRGIFKIPINTIHQMHQELY